jgi:hypothetical protein
MAKSEAKGEKPLNLDADSTLELRRQTVDQAVPADSAVIPNIEAWLKGRPVTKQREFLKHDFGDSEFNKL